MTRGDGNCLFRAVAFALTGSEEGHLGMRSSCATFMKSNGHILMNNGEKFSSFISEPWDRHCDRVAKAGEWGDHYEVLALSGVMRCTIYVHSYQLEKNNVEKVVWPANNGASLGELLPREIHLSLYVIIVWCA